MRIKETKLSMTALLAVGIVSTFAASSFGTVVIDMVNVGNPGNPNDTSDGNSNIGGVQNYGSVAYTYGISKYEVSNAQFVEFLNTVDPTGANSLGLYDASMTASTRGGINYSAGNPNGLKYSAKTGQGNNPVVFVNFFSSMRFVNWLHNGQTSGGTESGVYTISDGTSETRAPGATFWIPNVNEWYKAAYYDPTKGGSGYWLYALKTDSAPYSDQPPGTSSPDASKAANFLQDDGVANGYNDGYAVSGSTSFPSGNPLTDVGAYTTATSYYGTFDQAGNVSEWIEASQFVFGFGTARLWRDADWSRPAAQLVSSYSDGSFPNNSYDTVGFRVAGLFSAPVPEPSTVTLLFCGLGLLARRFNRKAGLKRP